MLKKLFILSLSVMLIACSVGCQKVATVSTVSENNASKAYVSSAATQSAAAPSEMPQKPKTEPKITIKEPKIDDKELSKKLIMLAETEIKRQCGEDVSAIDLELTNEITTHNDSFMSIVYQGDSEMNDAAHSKLVLFTQNIDLQTGNKLALTDVIDVNADFASLTMEKSKTTLDEVYAEFIGEMTEEDWLSRLTLVDKENSFDYSSYMDGGLTIFFQMPPVAGDYLPVANIPNEDLESFLKNKDLLKPKEEDGKNNE